MLTNDMSDKLNKIRPGAILELRKKRLWSQEQLAEVSGVSLRTIQRLEAGSTANFETLQALSQAFDIDAEQLLQPEGPASRKAKQPKVHILKRILTGQQFCDVVGGAHMRQIAHDEPTKNEELEALQSIAQHIQDVGDIWSDISASEQLQTAFDTTSNLKRLEAAGFWIFGKRRRVMVSTADGKIKTPMTMATFRIICVDSPEVIVATDGSQSLPFVDTTVGEPFNF